VKTKAPIRHAFSPAPLEPDTSNSYLSSRRNPGEMSEENVSKVAGFFARGPQGGFMPNDMTLFAKGLATYEKVVRENYMFHREVYVLLHRVLKANASKQFIFLDIACGTAVGSATALKDLPIGRYIGIDNSQISLDVAKETLSGLPCPVELRCHDFVEAISAWGEPADAIWIGQSLHHLQTEEKATFMTRIRTLLPQRGIFLIWETTCLEGEDRDGWMERFRQVRPQWPAITDEEFSAFDTHHRAADYPETAAMWIGMGRAAGFSRAEELFVAPNGLARVYRFSP
jgi:Methyltransferase domain